MSWILSGCGKPDTNLSKIQPLISSNHVSKDSGILKLWVKGRLKVLFLNLTTSSQYRGSIEGDGFTGEVVTDTHIFRYTNPPTGVKYMEIFLKTQGSQERYYLRFYEDGAFDGHQWLLELWELSETLRNLPRYAV
jgi:hypothetical protein